MPHSTVAMRKVQWLANTRNILIFVHIFVNFLMTIQSGLCNNHKCHHKLCQFVHFFLELIKPLN